MALLNMERTPDPILDPGSCTWSGMPDSNWRPLRPERSALPGCANPREWHRLGLRSERSDSLRPHRWAEGEGFEPPEPCGSADFESAALDQTMRPLRRQLYTVVLLAAASSSPNDPLMMMLF